jgi:histidine triad (HIT) family protein
MPSIFSKIIAGEIPSYKIAETDKYFAFLDINPLKEGHTLVIPKKEVDQLFELDDETYKGLWLFAKEVATALKKVIPCKRIGVAVIGLEVPHAHIHLIPVDHVGDTDFSKPKLKISADRYKEIAAAVAKAINT